jgi:hypothetical protein
MLSLPFLRLCRLGGLHQLSINKYQYTISNSKNLSRAGNALKKNFDVKDIRQKGVGMTLYRLAANRFTRPILHHFFPALI